jgi:hypothetical protein
MIAMALPLSLPSPDSSRSSRSRSPAVPRGLSAWQEHRLRIRLRRSAPTEPWVDAQLASQTFTGPDGEPVVARYHDAHVFPPGGPRRTGMRWCRACGRWTPPQAVSLIEHRSSRDGPVVSATLVCDDCLHEDDEDRHADLYGAGLHLRPASSRMVVGLRGLLGDRRHGE